MEWTKRKEQIFMEHIVIVQECRANAEGNVDLFRCYGRVVGRETLFEAVFNRTHWTKYLFDELLQWAGFGSTECTVWTAGQFSVSHLVFEDHILNIGTLLMGVCGLNRYQAMHAIGVEHGGVGGTDPHKRLAELDERLPDLVQRAK